MQVEHESNRRLAKCTARQLGVALDCMVPQQPDESSGSARQVAKCAACGWVEDANRVGVKLVAWLTFDAHLHDSTGRSSLEEIAEGILIVRLANDADLATWSHEESADC
jgi:hypothetical protein